MDKAHRCRWQEKKSFIRWFIITELVLLSAVSIMLLIL